MTYLQLVNAVLRRLRESEVSTVNASEYSKLISDFVNQVKREVEDAWNWNALRTTVTIPTVNGTHLYSVTGAGGRFRLLNILNVNLRYELQVVSGTYMDKLWLLPMSNNASLYYRFKGKDASGDPILDVWPQPNAVYSLQVNLVIPQADLSADTDNISVPSWPVVLGAYAMAISERGEDGGIGYNEADNAYRNALADAIAQDSGNFPHEMTAEVW